MSLRLAVFASGSGTNLQALIEKTNQVEAAWGRIALVVSDRPAVRALDRARTAGIATAVIPVVGVSEDDVAREMQDALDAHDIHAIALAGYLRLVPAAIVQGYRGRIVNIHPALLPAFGGKGMYGMRVHQAVLDAGCRVSGATVHLVDERYDEGAAVAQWPVPVLPGDTAETLAARVLEIEHRLYPLALEHLARLIAGLADARAATFAGFQPSDAPPEEKAMRRAFALD